MRETVLAFAPLGVVVYFVFFPGQLAYLMFMAGNLLR